MSKTPFPHLLDSTRWSNLRIGLLGGTFDPPHEGHVHISLAALKGLQLDYIWWLVTPQNPLKSRSARSLDDRMGLCRDLVSHPQIVVSDLERDLKTSITYQTIRQLKQRFKQTQFVWISGMDNALTLHQWQHWRELLGEVCMLHITRPPAKSLVRACPLRLYAPQHHNVIDCPGRYPLTPGKTYWMLQNRMMNISSTALRAKALPDLDSVSVRKKDR